MLSSVLLACAAAILVDAAPKPQAGGGALGFSADGLCGPRNGFTCQGSPFGNCCNQAIGRCGSRADDCISACNPAFGNCNFPALPVLRITTTTAMQTATTTTAATTTTSSAVAFDACPGPLYQNAQCCGTGIGGIADLDCADPTTAPTDAADFTAVCAADEKNARCCVLPVAGQAVLCMDPST